MICPNCSNPIKDDANFCPYCGFINTPAPIIASKATGSTGHKFLISVFSIVSLWMVVYTCLNADVIGIIIYSLPLFVFCVVLPFTTAFSMDKMSVRQIIGFFIVQICTPGIGIMAEYMHTLHMIGSGWGLLLSFIGAIVFWFIGVAVAGIDDF